MDCNADALLYTIALIEGWHIKLVDVVIVTFLLKHTILFINASGVARVPCARGEEIFLRHRQQKLIEFEVKNTRKSGKKQNRRFTFSYFVLFRSVTNCIHVFNFKT